MPVKAQGKAIKECKTGKTVGHGKTEKSAAASARIRNEAYEKKHGKKKHS